MKTKEDFIKAQLNTDKLTPLQWDGILRAMDNYAEQQVNSLPQAGETPLNYSSEQLIGSVQQRYNELEHKNWNWSSFYNGWLEGRTNMLKEIKG